eukprot:TRINITY_DN2309_c0_g1_i1.p1 TRINITY_DN2309_c0_g1~~TRINITY_DN2309_c0_g1_i1.p1  ORF type:complete len:475 (+),score=126.73 TRINITY_DN2309_c0_g1_i1:166-1425(+)
MNENFDNNNNKEVDQNLVSKSLAPDIHSVIEPSQNVEPIVLKIVLTGGPCGGKTTAVSQITHRLTSLGYKIYVVPEAMTILFTGGARFMPSWNDQQIIEFEASKIKTQIALEDAFTSLAKTSGKPSVVICDRGTMDSAAYLPPRLFQLMMHQYDWSVSYLRDKRYDAVIHLMSTAIGAENYYTTSNNQARHENLKEAAELDLKILNAWIGHSKLIIIDNSTDFSGKMNRFVTAVCRLLGAPRPAAIEKKFLVKSVKDIPVKYEKSYTEQTFLMRDSEKRQEGYIFVKKRENKGSTIFTYSAKHVFIDSSSAIIERQISAQEYGTLLAQSNPNREVVTKKLNSFVWNGHYFELNYYMHPHEGLIILKTDAEDSQQQIPYPPFIEVISEVTDDENYSTFTLAGPQKNEIEKKWKKRTQETN